MAGTELTTTGDIIMDEIVIWIMSSVGSDEAPDMIEALEEVQAETRQYVARLLREKPALSRCWIE